MTVITSPRPLEHEVAPLFANRWSPRAFTDEPISDADLFAAFEAARWAPSARNVQPWRFVYARKGTPAFDKFIGVLWERNQTWARNAAALVFILSKKTFEVEGEEKPLRSHSFDAGAAWVSFALQASLKGWSTHALGGLDYDKAREVLGVPDDFELEIGIAIGRRGDKAQLPESLKAQEAPKSRLPLTELVSEGRFSGK
ncbi:nitroreductase [Rhodoblastus sphagnicola]|uniref:Nitroreductase n=1 Tax=Rhodoblastus sphagnicola TaxID=333368 RepID=A0A2S6MU23_9HYPH|nr:nitroreductase family protein [Rhodoblastus sphagnicola]MBB4199802.1 nitroreductase [Rhodoblastus sphagnicola]PPQ25857.1 nitroreductase [Rhodoblastus sphagnicola]